LPQGEDESYTLEVDSQQARLSAPNPLGVLRGLETFLQLVVHDPQGFAAAAASIKDRPRFPWRGLLIDTARHWMPMEVLKRNIDAMAAVKLNVLHWHITDDQGFRIESKKFPKLHQMGSDGLYFTQTEVRELIDYARDRGVRVVPEFDMPGHTTSWVVGHPELASMPGPYQIERKWGKFDPTLDPSRESTYQFLDSFIGEMARLFDDEYFHIGGDEVNGKQWTASEPIQAFMRRNNLKDNHQLHRHFNRRLQSIVKKHGKRMIGWDEILDPDLPKDIVIHSWRGQKSLAEAVRQGYSGLLSAGYYLDHISPAGFHYLVDPIDETAAGLNDEQRSRILGGEACMWAEFATHMNIDSRMWPRAAAIAERLWSPQEVRDVASMYRRLWAVSRWLETTGVTHRSSYRVMLERLVGDDPVEPLRVLADVVEPVRFYRRGHSREYTQSTPLNRLVDAARPESEVALRFQSAVALMDWETVRRMLTEWRDNDARLRPVLERRGELREIAPLSANLKRVAEIGLAALDGKAPHKAELEEAKKPVAELLLMVVPGVEQLLSTRR
jgi:hexosaminidase